MGPNKYISNFALCGPTYLDCPMFARLWALRYRFFIFGLLIGPTILSFQILPLWLYGPKDFDFSPFARLGPTDFDFPFLPVYGLKDLDSPCFASARAQRTMCRDMQGLNKGCCLIMAGCNVCCTPWPPTANENETTGAG